MKTALAAALAVAVAPAVLATSASWARAAEGPNDVETDHIDAFDDGGPRSFGMLVNPLALVLGTFAAEGDFVLGDAAALSVEGDWGQYGGTDAYGVTLGVPLYPWRVVFHGIYVHPRVMVMRASMPGAAADVLGGGGSIGWQQTWRFGLTLKVGAGAAYEKAFDAPAGAGSFAVEGVRPLLDGEVGWVF